MCLCSAPTRGFQERKTREKKKYFSHPGSERNGEKQLMPLTREKDIDKELMIPLTHKDFKLYSQKNPLKWLGQQQHAVVFGPCRVPGQLGGGF